MARRALGRGLGALIPDAGKLLDRRDEESEEALERDEPAPSGEEQGRGVGGVAGGERRAGDEAGRRGVSEEESPGRRVSPAELDAGPGEVAPEGVGGVASEPRMESAGAEAGRDVSGASVQRMPSGGPRAGELTRPRAAARRALASGRATAVIEIAVDRIAANPYQPRERFDERELEELVGSIRSKGVLQPVLVRRRGVGYELIAGERRLRAARRAGLEVVPAIVRDAQDSDMLEIAIIENQQRVDLNPIEAAEAYGRATEEFGLSQDELATIVGKDRSTVANVLRLLTLPANVQTMVREGALEMGHARALAGVKNETRCLAIARRVVRHGLSVRAVEKLVGGGGRHKPAGRRRTDPELVPFEDRLRRRFGTQVRIARNGGRGRIEIEFYNQDDLERILNELQVLAGG